MKRALTLVLTVAMLLPCVAVFSSCSRSDDNGAVINAYYVGEVFDFDPAGAYVDDAAIEIMSLLFEPLFEISASGKLTGALAKGYKYYADTNTLEITLKETYWSNGASVTANDVLYAWERILEPEFKCAAAPLLYDIKNAIEVKNGDTSKYNLGVTADRKLLTIELVEGANVDTFLRNLASVALSPINESIITKSGREEYWTKRTFTLVTNGPFKVTNLKYNDGDAGDSGFRLERNPYYSRSIESETSVKKFVTPYRIETDWMLTLEDAYAAYIEGTIFYLGDIPLSARAENASSADVNDALSTYSYVFNFNNPLFADENVRLALSAAIDRNYVVTLITFGKAATGLIPYGVSEGKSLKKDFASFNTSLISSSANMDLAKSYIAKANLSGLTKQFTLTYRNSEEASAIAEYVKAQWTELGFNVTLKAVNRKSLTVYENDQAISLNEDALQLAYQNGDFDVIGIDYQMLSTNAFVPLAGFSSEISGNGTDMDTGAETGVYNTRTHICGFKSAEYDAIIADAFAEKDESARATLLHNAESYLIDHMVIMPVVFNQTFCLVKKDITGLKQSYFGFNILKGVNLKNYKKYLAEDTENQ